EGERRTKAQQVVAAGVAAREPKGRLDGFRSTGVELKSIQSLRRDFRDFVHQLRPWLGSQTAQGQLLYLLGQHLHVLGMTVPERIDADPTDQIDVGISVDVRQIAAPSALHGNACPEGKGLKSRRQVALLARHHLPRLRTGNLGLDVNFAHRYDLSFPETRRTGALDSSRRSQQMRMLRLLPASWAFLVHPRMRMPAGS